MFKKIFAILAVVLFLIPSALALQGDLNGDGAVNFDDFFIFADQYGQEGEGSADLNNDGKINFDDFFIFADNYGKIEQPTNSPPVIKSILGNRDVLEGQTVTIRIVAEDAEDKEDLTYSISSGKFTQNGNTFVWQTNLEDEGSYPLTVSVHDTKGLGASVLITVKVINVEPAVVEPFEPIQPPVEEPEQPTTSDLNKDGIIDVKDFLIFVEQFGSQGTADLNKDGVVSFDDFFIFADKFGQIPEIPLDPIKLTNPDPRDNAEGTNPQIRTFSWDSLIEGGVTYEFYLIKGSAWLDNGLNNLALEDIRDLRDDSPLKTVISSSARPSVTAENLHEFTVYYWRIKAIDSAGRETLSPIWKFFTHHRGTSDVEFVAAEATNLIPIASIINDDVIVNGRGAYMPLRGVGIDPDGTIVSYEWLISGVTHQKGLDKNEIIVSFPDSGRFEAKLRVQDDKNALSEWDSIIINIDERFAPNRPSNPSPVSGSRISSSEAIFSWDGGDRDSNRVRHNFEISRNPQFTFVIEAKEINWASSSMSGSPNVGIEGLNPELNYWWRIIATDDTGFSTYSPVWTFGPGVVELPQPQPVRVVTTESPIAQPPVQPPVIQPPAQPPVQPPVIQPPVQPPVIQPPAQPPVQPVQVNNPPVLAAIGNKNINEGQTLTFAVSATDADGDAIVYGATGLPTNASFTIQTFTWTPSFTQSGVYVVTFTATDSTGRSDSEAVTITVNNVNQAPVLNTISDIVINEGQEAVIVPVATDIDGDAISYTINNPKFIKQSDNRFVWKTGFNDAGTYRVTVAAFTPDGKLTSQEVRVEVKDVKIKHPRVAVANAEVLNLNGIVNEGEPLELFLNIRNEGNTDNEDTTIVVTIPELGINEVIGTFSLDSGSRYFDIVEIGINDAISGEEYYFIVKAESDDVSDIKYGSFILV